MQRQASSDVITLLESRFITKLLQTLRINLCLFIRSSNVAKQLPASKWFLTKLSSGPYPVLVLWLTVIDSCIDAAGVHPYIECQLKPLRYGDTVHCTMYLTSYRASIAQRIK